MAVTQWQHGSIQPKLGLYCLRQTLLCGALITEIARGGVWLHAMLSVLKLEKRGPEGWNHLRLCRNPVAKWVEEPISGPGPALDCCAILELILRKLLRHSGFLLRLKFPVNIEWSAWCQHRSVPWVCKQHVLPDLGYHCHPPAVHSPLGTGVLSLQDCLPSFPLISGRVSARRHLVQNMNWRSDLINLHIIGSAVP